MWVRLKYMDRDGRWMGIAEDITKERLEILKVEYERDYDSLTNLLNRRAFHREMGELFGGEKREKLGCAALVMMDLDNLKYINDTYGHDFGDAYIKTAAKALVEATPPHTLVARMSGDEFFIFFYGYKDAKSVRTQIQYMKKSFNEQSLSLPDAQSYRLRASGGVAWYPADSTDYEQLIRYADFAMYKVKNTIKGELTDFDIGSYNRESYLLQSREELNKLLDGQYVEYHFQPIVDAHTGEVFAYEALLRSNLQTLRNPYEILTLAKKEAQLQNIEWLTWSKSLEAFVSFLKNGVVQQGCRVLINSIPNQWLSGESIKKLEGQFGDYLHLVVQEVTEEEKVNESTQMRKSVTMSRWGAKTALDDFGSGYNSESVLLSLAPQFVKIDISLIRDIETDEDKQQIVRNLITYAHERSMLLIAEGVETLEEMKCVIGMGIDYLQGFFLARPAARPPKIGPEKRELIRQTYEKRENADEGEGENPLT